MLNANSAWESMLADLAALQKALAVKFKKKSLLEQALVHDSYVNENPGIAAASNERLEFLGDAFLGLVVAEKLFQDFPDAREGQMTQLRASLVRRESLARIAQAIGLGDHLYLGKGEEASGGRTKVPNLAGALEAVLGALYLDRGLGKARDCTLRLLATELRRVASEGVEVDYKSQLQELVQARAQRPPTYVVVDTSGPDHDRHFTVEVRLGRDPLGRGSGRSKKAAESAAARDALEKLKSEP